MIHYVHPCYKMSDFVEAIMEFKDKVLHTRAKLNLTQKELGELLHVTLTTVNRWESGKVQPTKKALCSFNQLCKKNLIVFDDGDAE